MGNFIPYLWWSVLWVAAMAMDITPGLLGARLIVGVLKQRGQVFTASAALVERFGSFTIIVPAECILGTVSGITEVKDRQPVAWAAAVLAFLGLVSGLLFLPVVIGVRSWARYKSK